MIKLYHTIDGDRLDLICYRHYGHLNGTLEYVLEQTPELSLLPQRLPAGLEIPLPALPLDRIAQQGKKIYLW